MKISIEEKSGFCVGVLRVVELAENILDQGGELYCLGQIVHNESEVKRLVNKGLKLITHNDLPHLHNCKLLLRAHGEPPETYEIARKNNIEIIDGTCFIVKKIQNRIKKDDVGQEKIIIYGKINHPEVKGLRAQVKDNAEIIGTLEEAKNIPLSGKVHLYAQTTMDPEKYNNIASLLKMRLKNEGGELKINHTICGQVSHRKPGLVKFAKENDLLIFMAGSNSSNGRMLFEACKAENDRCYYITDHQEIKKEWFSNVESVGITGATSTPRWQIKNAYERVKKLTKNE